MNPYATCVECQRFCEIEPPALICNECFKDKLSKSQQRYIVSLSNAVDFLFKNSKMVTMEPITFNVMASTAEEFVALSGLLGTFTVKFTKEFVTIRKNFHEGIALDVFAKHEVLGKRNEKDSGWIYSMAVKVALQRCTR